MIRPSPITIEQRLGSVEAYIATPTTVTLINGQGQGWPPFHPECLYHLPLSSSPVPANMPDYDQLGPGGSSWTLPGLALFTSACAEKDVPASRPVPCGAGLVTILFWSFGLTSSRQGLNSPFPRRHEVFFSRRHLRTEHRLAYFVSHNVSRCISHVRDHHPGAHVEPRRAHEIHLHHALQRHLDGRGFTSRWPTGGGGVIPAS